MARKTGRKKKPSERELQELDVHQGLRELLEGRGGTVSLARTLDGRGGHCVVRGERRVILSGRMPVGDRNELLADVLRTEDLEGVFVRPDLRERIDAAAPTRGGASPAARGPDVPGPRDG